MHATPLALRRPLARTSALLLALLLSLAFGAMRAAGTLGPAQLRWLLPLGFVIMMALPWLLLAPQGRRQIGLRWPAHPAWYATAVAAGVAAAALCFGLGLALYGSAPDNWFVSIGASYAKVMNTAGLSILMLHLMLTIPACLFSPLGEELFFRGYLQRALESRFSARASTHLEAALFGLVHLCHHGLAAGAAGLAVRPVSAALWVLLMFSTAWLFAWLRQRSDSLAPAMLAHAAFNATMNVCIFAALWPPQ